MTKPRYTKTAPSKEGYFWIQNQHGEVVEIAFFFELPFGGWTACCTRAGDVNWKLMVARGNTRSVKEVRP